MRSLLSAQLVAIALILLATGCGGNELSGHAASSIRLQGVNVSDVGTAAPHEQAVQLSAAKNEWTNFVVQVSGLPPHASNRPLLLRVQTLKQTGTNATIAADNISTFQLLNMPVDVNRAGYVRHTGLLAANRQFPRALLPMTTTAGQTNLDEVRDPAHPTDPKLHPSPGNSKDDQPLLLWVDLHIPPEARAGNYIATCDVIESGSTKALVSVPVQLTVYDFVLSDERHLQMVGSIEWDDLTRLYTDRFEAVTPRLMRRGDARYDSAITTLDQLVNLAQANRVQLVVPRLQPTVKWPPGKPPQVDWTDYDSIVAPWMRGEIFKDKTPFGFWPLPAADNLYSYDQRSQRDYWSDAASHFDQMDWLTRGAVILPGSGHRADSAEAIKISGDASQILALNPRLRVEVPLEDDQVQFANANNANLVKPEMANRLVTANPGLVFSSPLQNWPTGVPRPSRWLRTDLTGLMPYVGAGGDERDVRVWSWFASVPLPPPPINTQLGPVQYIRWANALPRASKPTEPADPNDLIWFYPGNWFGVDQPVPTMQLKWLRRAQQDFEYLYLARQRGETINALVIARLMSKPVELQPSQSPDPTFGLMSGTADASAWNGAINLLAQRILLREPGQPVNEERDHQLNIELNRWAEPQERPVPMGRTVHWLMENVNGGVNTIDVALGVDIYNDADRQPENNSLQFGAAPAGWHYKPQPKVIPQLATYQVQRFALEATVEPTEVHNNDRKPVDVVFTDGFTKKQSKLQMMLPVAHCDRREGRLSIDGSLEDWMPDDAILDGQLVRMFSRPALQKQQIEFASTQSSIYTGWADENLYVAFKLNGLQGAEWRTNRNFVTYQLGRAWDEDLCELLIQPVYADNTVGPLLHLVCKPNGSCWVERKMDPRKFVDPWQPIAGVPIRYAPSIDEAIWRGEVAIPWKAVTDDPQKGRPVMLRFNFTQHRALTGESASRAGPVDFGRDENFMGLLVLREADNPGMR